MLEPKRIIKNGIATIVFWNDGTKTIVKCAADDEPDDYMAFCAAYCKKIFGSNSRLKRTIKKAVKAKPKKEDTHKVSNTKSLLTNFSLVQTLMDDYRRYMEKRVEAEIVSSKRLYRMNSEPQFKFLIPMPGCKNCESVNICPECFTTKAVNCGDYDFSQTYLSHL